MKPKPLSSLNHLTVPVAIYFPPWDRALRNAEGAGSNNCGNAGTSVSEPCARNVEAESSHDCGVFGHNCCGKCKVKGVEPSEFGAFYARHEDAILLFFLRRGATPDLAADLTAETFAAALCSLDRFEPDGPPLIAWLYGIARNVLAMSRRRGAVEARARKRLGMEPLLLTDAAIEAIDSLGSGEASRVLAELPSEQREAIEARVIGEQSYPAIAESLRCSEMVVRQRVSRGLRELRTRLEEGS